MNYNKIYMKNILAGYLQDLKTFVSSKYIILFSFITIALGYGFALTNPSVSTDDTAASLYFEGGELIAQGRFFPVIINKLLGGMNFTPFWLEFMAIIMMVLAGLLYLCLFKKVTKDKLSKVCYVLFIPIFISYPLINEIFIYNTAVISIGIGYLFTAIAILCAYEFVNIKKRSWPLAAVAILLMAAVASTYESFVAVFILGLAMILFLDNLYNHKDIGFNKKKWVKYLLVFAAITVSSVVIEYAVTNIYIDVNHIVRSTNAATSILWLGPGGFLNNIRPLLASIKFWFIMTPGLEYVSIMALQIATVSLLALAAIKSFVRKNYWLLLFAGLLILSIFSLSIVQGIASPYRVCQTFALFIAFVAIVIYDQTPNKVKPLILLGVIYLITIQTYDLTKWFYNDSLRYQEDRVVMINVAETIKRDFDATKPVVFMGKYIQSPLIRHNQTNGGSFINWGQGSFGGPGEQLLTFLDMNGEHLVRPTKDQYNMAQENLNNMAKWPKSGSVAEYKGVIVVRF